MSGANPTGPTEVPASLAGTRVDRLVALLTGLSRSDVSQLVDAGGVRLGGHAVTSRSHRARAGDLLEIDLASVPAVAVAAGGGVPAASADVAFAVVHEDEEIVVVDKPAGLVVHPGAGNLEGTLVAGLLDRYPELAALAEVSSARNRPGIVHRLDKDTSGLLVVARTAAALVSLSAQLAARTMGRDYLAVVCGLVGADEGVVDAPLGRSTRHPTRMAVTGGERGKQARTRYAVRHRFHTPIEATQLEVGLDTGRTHQIRVHLAAIDHPVLGDSTYGGRRREVAVGRPFLHAFRLRLEHPSTGASMTWTSPLPQDLQHVLDTLS